MSGKPENQIKKNTIKIKEFSKMIGYKIHENSLYLIKSENNPKTLLESFK